MRLELHEKQWLAFESEATEILFGGSANSGKSHLIRIMAISWCLAVPGIQVYIFRREYGDLRKNHFEGPSSFLALLADWIGEGYVKFNVSEMSLAFSNGSKIHACHCQHEKDVYGYQGAEIHALIVDELTHFSDTIYRFLRGRCRIGGLEVPEDCPWKFPRILSGSNPGGVGHNWVKASFIDSAPPMQLHQASDEEGGMVRQFIPARMADNPTGDPVAYRRALLGLGRPELIKAMLDGDWNIVAGGMLDDVWSDRVIRKPEAIPAGWRIDRGFDWGSSAPFAVVWFAEADGTATASGWCPPKGSIICFAEWYGWNGKPNEGMRLTAAEIARGILKAEDEMGIRSRVNPGPADSAIFASENGNCIADDMARIGVRWQPADKGPGSRVNGWELMRRKLRAAGQQPVEEAGLYIFDTCRHLIRTLPTLPRDPRKQEDVDTGSEDHCADALRYRLATKRFGIQTVSGF